jgi:ATP-dependent DNA helicase RecG
MYTRKRGLDRETNKALLLKHIENNDQDGSRFRDFKQVLPALSDGQIKVMLKNLSTRQRFNFRAKNIE